MNRRGFFGTITALFVGLRFWKPKAETVYFTPYKRSTISIYDGLEWRQVSVDEVTISLNSSAEGS